jgi:hypothetical protein
MRKDVFYLVSIENIARFESSLSFDLDAMIFQFLKFGKFRIVVTFVLTILTIHFISTPVWFNQWAQHLSMSFHLLIVPPQESSQVKKRVKEVVDNNFIFG